MVGLDAIVARHYEVLRKVNADASMQPQSKYATIARKEYFRQLPTGQFIPTPERRRLHEQWIAEYVAEYSDIKTEKHAVVMAGPPGAGKGFVQDRLLGGLPSFVVCDPDKFKEKILEYEIQIGRFDELKPPVVQQLETQGERFAPLEFSALVHEESSFLNGRLQDLLMQREMNFVIDTVLKVEASAQTIAARLDRAGYTYDVVSVQTTRDISKASIRDRWEQPYRKFLQNEHSKEGRLGGRSVPSEFSSSVFPQEGGTSTTQTAARWLAQNGAGVQSFQHYRRVEGKAHILVQNMVKRGRKLITRPTD